ncbi:MAG: hypothetical protein K8T89_07100 [Planctomycetes bacterium]|nr:hypothetical protein [Planctomycetota bacterium]
MTRRNTRDASTDTAPSATDEPGTDGASKTEQPKNRPVFSVGPIMTDPSNSCSAAVWLREVKLEDGREFTAHSVSCEATYRDKDDNWQKAGSFRSNQLPTLIYCLQRCFDWVQSQRDPKQKAG